MRIRIGTNNHNYRNYGHGRSQMSEFERLMHLIVSLQILFGSRRGGIWIPVVLLALIFGGIFFYNQMYNNPERMLASADQQWNTGIEREQMAAINSYMEILEKKDGNFLDKILNPSKNAKRSDEAEPLLKDVERRKELYSRIIRHKFRFINPDDAAVWVRRAVSENISLTFIGKDGTEDEELTTFWKNATATLSNKKPKGKTGPNRKKRKRNSSNATEESESGSGLKLEPLENEPSEIEPPKGEFEEIPGLDDVRKLDRSPQYSFV